MFIAYLCMGDSVTIVGAQDANTQFTEWLLRVERGEEFTITRDGSPIARLVPATRPATDISRAAAIVELRQIAGRNRLAELRVKDLAAEGRR